ncbi:MAG TPA: Asp-tRNA(Asn)/Glu-tRNA(Gln) amidotransferase GatCAB subunit A, partial [Spirochaetes bacterium]|nr:Asp-tRNA(Asn)/Glu-tRNA(Gln) amidotransferase GatCAB subunit A [Spirochaetota bacterium]
MLTEKTVLELSGMLSRGETSAVEIAAAYAERIRVLNGGLNAYVDFDEGRLRSEAEASDKRRKSGSPLSPWDGVPVAIKDNICTEGIRTSCGSGILRDFVPPYDATVYAHLKKKGFVTLGKTNLDEFAMGSTTETSY